MSVRAFVKAIERNDVCVAKPISFAIGKLIGKKVFLVFVGVIARCGKGIQDNLALVFQDDTSCAFLAIFCLSGF